MNVKVSRFTLFMEFRNWKQCTIKVNLSHNNRRTFTLGASSEESAYHNSSGNLRAGSILSTWLTHKLAHTAWYWRPPYVSLAHCSSLSKSLQAASTSNKHTPQARNWETWSSDFKMLVLKSRCLSSGCKDALSESEYPKLISFYKIFNIAFPSQTR